MAGLNDLPKRDQYLVVAGVLAILGAGAFWYLVYGPKEADVFAPMAIRVEALDSLNKKAAAQMNQQELGKLRAEAEASERTLDIMRQLVPSGNEVPSLLNQVSDAGRRSGLEIAGVQPQPVIEGDQFDTYRYKMTVIGSYHRVGEFLANIGSLTRIMAPADVRLSMLTSSGAASRKKKDEATLQVEFELQTFVAKASQNARRGGRTS